MLAQFLITVVSAYAAMAAVYLGFGAAAEAYLARRQDRKIQPERDGLRRKRQEIGASLRALGVSALLFGGGYFAREQGWAMEAAPLTPLGFVLWFVVALILFDAWFYFGHRLLHWGPMYRFHALHHKSVAPTVWSNDSSGVVDTLIEHGFYLIVWFILPAPALSLIALRLFDQISGMIGHSGFEFFAGPTARRPWPFICPTFHDLHHSRFSYNYGNMFSVWDRLLGTAHPDYDDMVRKFEHAD